MDCVEVCPVDCFYEGENMLVIHPDECIDCGVCEPECPVDAIKPDTVPGVEKWVALNAEYATAEFRGALSVDIDGTGTELAIAYAGGRPFLRALPAAGSNPYSSILR